MFGLGPSARLFTKTLAPVIRFLKKAIDLAVVGYLDDFLMQDEDYEACALKTKAAIIIFFCLGFRVNHEKSVIEPTREVEHLGLRWNTKKMTVSLTEKRMTNIEEKAENIKRRGGCTLKELQSFLGKLEASSAAIIIARLHFRFMQALLRGKEDDKEFIKFNEKDRSSMVDRLRQGALHVTITSPKTGQTEHQKMHQATQVGEDIPEEDGHKQDGREKRNTSI